MDENKTYGTRLARLWKLFLSTLYISSFTFGGGFVIVTFMKKKFVDELHWIDEQEMLDMTALAQSSPGAIAVNAAILVGWQVEGLIGMIVAVLGTIIPPMVILSVISVFYNAFATNRYIALLLKGMQAGVAAVILDVVFDLGGKVFCDICRYETRIPACQTRPHADAESRRAVCGRDSRRRPFRTAPVVSRRGLFALRRLGATSPLAALHPRHALHGGIRRSTVPRYRTHGTLRGIHSL